jgi:hypothetical protein
VGVERIDSTRIARESVEAMGLNPREARLTSPEALAVLLRRAASFLCPATPGMLSRVVRDCLRGLPEFREEDESEIRGLLDSLVSYGDLLELPLDDGSRVRRQLFLGPPAYVLRSSALALLVGVRPEGAPLLGEDLAPDIEYKGYARFIRSKDDRMFADLLSLEGLIELRPDQWLQAPRPATAEDVVASCSDRLDAAGPSGDIDGFQVMDPASRVTYYRGRWRILKPRDDGRFVGRRPQAFGADLWCFADVANGNVRKLIDLPIENPLAPGADEAWRLQAALDAIAGHPQQLRVRRDGATSVLDFFAPVPSWIRRRLDIVGEPVPRGAGALFSYAVAQEEIEEEISFLNQMMWLSLDQELGGINDGAWQPNDR